MYARMITVQYQPGKIDEGVQIYREALTVTRQQPGFKGVLGLIDRSANKGISITLWESEADALASGAGSATMQSQLANFASVFAAAPLFETYEVVVQE